MARTGKDFWVWRYRLESAAPLNAVSNQRIREGALVRAGNGFGCIHPWPELGDEPLREQLSRLAAGQNSPILRQTLRCIEADGAAREQGRSLFADTAIPESHWLYRQGDDPIQISSAGFSAVKCKIGPGRRNLSRQSKFLEELAEAKLKLRLDANVSVDFPVFEEWWKSLKQSVRDWVEFVEDPVPPALEHWEKLSQLGVPLAVDRYLGQEDLPSCWLVYKPAINDEKQIDGGESAEKKIAVTSYMDHPLGQMWAACEAAELARKFPARVGLCGLLTHHCFASDAFSEQIETRGPRLIPPEGTGLGFDELLEKLPWKRLT